MKVAGETVIEPKAEICFQRLVKASFELRPSANGIQATVDIQMSDGIWSE
jgi:hypothetical protein